MEEERNKKNRSWHVRGNVSLIRDATSCRCGFTLIVLVMFFFLTESWEFFSIYLEMMDKAGESLGGTELAH